ncbi:putative type IV pilin secretion protein [Pasteurella multocida subsp. multocida OH4807]|nr:putative type IV pilin secretion protein [Pasteurella multocida subsp. multocida OH4807]
MPKLKLFRWHGLNRLNHKQKGMIIAENRDFARQILFQRGFRQLTLQRNWVFWRKANHVELCDFWIQLSLLLHAAVPLKESLQILQQRCVNITLYQWLTSLLAGLESGLSFPEALEQSPYGVTKQEKQMIAMSQLTGTLAQTCKQIAQQRQKTLALQRKVQKILLYPMLVLSISVLLTVLLLLFIVPQFAEIYGTQPLPLFTSILFVLSDGLHQYGLQMMLISGLVMLLIRLQLTRSSWLRQKKVSFISSLPLLSHVVQLHRLVYFTRHVSLMLNAGIPLEQALHCFLPNRKSWQVKQNEDADPVLAAEVRFILSQIKAGYAFSDSVSGVLFTDSAQQMLQVAEKSGKLPMVLHYVADNAQQQLEHQLDLLAQLLEPLLMLIIGGLIGMIILGMYLPLFNMSMVIQ